MRFSLLILIFISLILDLHAQLARVEFPAEQEDDVYRTVPCGNKGVLVIHETSDIFDSETKNWSLQFFDSELDTLWTKNIPIIFGLDFKAYEFTDQGSLVLFFYGEKKIRSLPYNFQLIELLIPGSEMRVVQGETSEKGEVTDFELMGNTVVFSLNLNSGVAELYFFNLQTADLFKSVINLEDENFVEEIYADSATGTFDVIIANYLSKRQNSMLYFNFNHRGEILNRLDIHTKEADKFLNTARVIRYGDNIRFLAGTYSASPGRIPDDKTYESKSSAGIFIACFEGSGQKYIHYYNFLDFENLKAGMTSKDYYKIQKRSYKESSEFSLSYSLLVHDLFLKDSNICILLESYYPDFRTVSDITYDYWGRPIPQTYTVFEGYKYTNAIIAAFDVDGNLQWDNSLDIYNISSFDLEKRISYLFDDAVVVLFYNEAGKITYKAIREDVSVTGLSHAELDLLYSGDKILSTGYDNITQWYDNYYLCYGYQRIRNNTRVDISRRTVFYISKVSFE